MKLTVSAATIVFGAIALSEYTALALSAGCSSYLDNLATPSNPLYSCRVYTALGFPDLTHANDHDTSKLEKALSTYCAAPACTADQYASVLNNLQANCADDMVPDNQATLGTVMYMWYMSPAQREAVCYKNAAMTSYCVIDSMNEMISRAQLPDSNPNEDDLYGYLQYVTPMASPINIDNVAFCTVCNQQIANIFSNYYTKNPAPFTLNFAQGLESETLNINLMDQYQRACGAALGKLMVVSGNTPGAFQPTNSTGSGVLPPGLGSGAAGANKMVSWKDATSAFAAIVGAMTIL
ncbi:hypothetical protein BGX28_001524 [Mortierella sp. GBA30]|nr:hypothetical protein BGX28_001524 [Mortierella sp. GBA30]